VDGVQRSYGDSGVPFGEHFLQVECPKGDYFAKWSKLAKDPKWIKICPYKFDVNDMPKVEDDIFADFDADIPDVANEEPVVTEPEKTKKPKKPKKSKEEPKPPAEDPTDAQAQIDKPTDPLERQRVPAKVWEKINKPLLVGAGVSAIAAGAVYYLAVQDRMAFDDPNNPDVLMPEDLEVLRDSTNTKVYVSAGLGVSAVGLYTAAFWKVRF
ncbi:MAG: hypothetical protein VX278_04990, partial [Myxococcota bacterium]|nr:hypothetical protein [Myxococcota bacterium]